MKKLFLSILILAVFSSIAYADWSITVTWTRSTGPNLDYEEVLMDGSGQCTVQETEATTCTWSVADLTNQEIIIRSYNEQGASSDYVVGNLFPVPAPASGGVINILSVP